jgi:hypothetical protein
MPPADPPHPSRAGAPERDPYEADESELAEEAARAGGAGDLEALHARGDVAGLLALAKAYRSGTAPGGRDMKKCLEAYRAAAELGSAEAEYGIALFHMNGATVVAQDLKEGTMHLRLAAERGSVPAKVYLGNLYELGIHYKVDPEKADVWYRNAGRGARIEAEQGGGAWNRALADLGCARHALLLTGDPAMGEEEKKRLLARAKAHGYGLRIRENAHEAPDPASGDRATFVDALAGAEASAPTAAPAAAPAPAADAKRRAEAGRVATRNTQLSSALGAFGYALLFALAGAGAGYAATLGARELVAHGHVLPLVGTKTRLVFPILLGLVGVLPAWLVYKLGTVLKALVLGAAVSGIGWVAWGTGHAAFSGDRPLQSLAFGLAGFLAGLLVLGLRGGAKLPRSFQRPR